MSQRWHGVSMEVDLWPIVGRAQLVQAFRPGEAASEGPFRTLRSHGWATPGVSVVTRAERRASGRLTIFSVLNLFAARSAREGDKRAARAWARAAARVEKSATFTRVKALLTGKSIAEVSAAAHGAVSSAVPGLLEALREVARETRRLRAQQGAPGPHTEVVAGRILEVGREGLVLQAETGVRTLVPRWLGEAAQRSQVGDLLALVSDRLDSTQLVVEAVPAIDVSEAVAEGGSPFGRAAPVRDLTAADRRLLTGAPAPLELLVPVTIEA